MKYTLLALAALLVSCSRSTADYADEDYDKLFPFTGVEAKGFLRRPNRTTGQPRCARFRLRLPWSGDNQRRANLRRYTHLLVPRGRYHGQ